MVAGSQAGSLKWCGSINQECNTGRARLTLGPNKRRQAFGRVTLTIDA